MLTDTSRSAFLFFVGVGALFAANPARAVDTALLRMQCAGLAGTCFETLDNLNTWLAALAPHVGKPARIEVGPGVFRGTFECRHVGGVALVGAGASQSVFTAIDGTLEPGVMLEACVGLAVSDLGVRGGYSAVHLGGTSTSIWTNVALLGGGRGVYSSFQCDPAQTRHEWRNARIEAIPRGMTVAYDARCGSHRIVASELLANGVAAEYGSTPNNVVALKADRRKQPVAVRVLGSELRAVLEAPNTGAIPVAVVQADNGAAIDVSASALEVASTQAHEIEALRADSGGRIRVEAASYRLVTRAPGTVTRIRAGSGEVAAAHHWSVLPDPAQTPGYRSVHGADTGVRTTTADGHPHPVIYDQSCPVETPWYDAQENRCH